MQRKVQETITVILDKIDEMEDNVQEPVGEV